MKIYGLDENMWDDVESEIAHLSLLILVLAREYPLNIIYVDLDSGRRG
jgi:hypothetical protein